MTSVRGSPGYPLFRSIALPVAVTAGLLLVVLVVQLITTHRSLNRLTPLQAHLAVMQRVHERILSMQVLALGRLEPAAPASHPALEDLNRAIADLAAAPALLSPAGRRHIEAAGVLLRQNGLPSEQALQRGIALLHQALAEESRAHAAQLQAVQAQARLERDLSLAALIAIPLASLLVFWLRRRRFLDPLRGLNTLLVRLADREFVAARVGDVEPVLEPLFANYNRMVARLAELEARERSKREALEASVRAATRDLLAHNRRLAEADRLAVVGEMAASLAHELRNPLAGILMALSNLRQDATDPDARQRLDLVLGELKRVDSLLTGLLDQARQRPEEAIACDLSALVGELVTLVRYQTEANVRIDADVPHGLGCRLPENRLRQALLNLLLNAAQMLPEGGRVRVAAQVRDGRLRLEVSDDGPGFPDPLLSQGPRAFASARAGGTGLGLASVRRLAQDTGGELKLDNPAGGGGRVTLILPCAATDDR